MINPSLMLKLLENNIVRKDTEFTATYMGRDLTGCITVTSQGNFLVVNVYRKGDDYVFEGASTVDGHRRMIKSADVIQIDGMDPVRLASVHGLSVSGDKLKQGKRRGRKPKHLLPEAA